jgi:hypothetical protein
MIIFEFDWEPGKDRNVWWLGRTSVTGKDAIEEDNIYEQIAAEEVHLDEN